MLHREQDLYAYSLYPFSKDFVDSEARTAAVSPQGLTARESALRPPIHLDTLLICIVWGRGSFSWSVFLKKSATEQSTGAESPQ
jgi:hypothetical protein